MSRRGPKGPQPSRQKSDLADVVEMLLDKGIVINADIAITVGDTEFIGIKVRAAIASFETAAKYGLEFPSGTDRRRVEEQTGVPAVTTDDPIDDDQTRLSEMIFDDKGAGHKPLARAGTPNDEDESSEESSEDDEIVETATADDNEGGDDDEGE